MTTITPPLWFHVPSITLKNIPRTLHAELKRRARARHRSLNKEAIATLQAVLSPNSPSDLETIVQQARDTRNLFERPVSVRDIASWKNSGRP